ncbi:MAG: hypothetical protein ACKV2T_10230 [Kofleriaceae bacterium]
MSDSTITAIRRYLASAISRIDRVIGAAALVHPKGDFDRAARAMSPLVETLAGLAIGTIVGGVAQAVRRSHGPQVTAKIAAMLAAQVASYEPHPIPAIAILDESPARSFRDELAKRLRARIAMLAGDARGMLVSIAQIVVASGPDRALDFERVLGTCAVDSILDEKYARDLQRGWDAWDAVVGNTTAREQTPLWRLWSQRVRGERHVLTPSAAEVVVAGFIARIG